MLHSAPPPHRPPSPTSGARRYPGLDGLRAIAVTAVVVYHLFPGVLPGGFLGVDVFFVVSGFLITSLLLREHRQNGRIALGAFWVRRARRLLPALAALLAVVGTAAWLVGGDVQLGLGRQLAGAATFTSNWTSIAAGQSYFDQTSPELFRNLWSLAVEEQFYVLWPLAVLALLLVPLRRLRTGVVWALAAVSVVLMALWFAPGDPTRAYFGSDTHAFGLLIGAAVALAAAPGAPRPSHGFHPAVRRAATATAAVVLAAGILTAMLLLDDDEPIAYRGGIAAVSLAVVGLIVLAGRSRLGPLLDARPLKWVGDRSYGVYLWHWPVFLIAVALLPAGAPAGWVALPVTLLVAAVSYRVLEQPVRRLGFRGAARAAFGRVRAPSWPRRAVATLAPIGAAALVLGTVLAVSTEPEQSTASANIERGMASIAASDPAGPDAASEGPSGPGGADAGSGTDAGSGHASGTPVEAPVVADRVGATGPHVAKPYRPDGSAITAIGDSVMLAAAPELQEAFPGIHIDAAVSRSMWTAPDILRDLDARGELRERVVIGLGTNGVVDPEVLDEVIAVVGPERELVLVNAFAERDWIAETNDQLAACADRDRTVALANWHDAIAPHPDYLADDLIHPGPSGGAVYADAVRDAIVGLEAESAAHRDRPRLADLVR